MHRNVQVCLCVCGHRNSIYVRVCEWTVDGFLQIPGIDRATDSEAAHRRLRAVPSGPDLGRVFSWVGGGGGVVEVAEWYYSMMGA